MTAYFYAEEHRHGIGTTTTIRRGGKEIIVSAGSLLRFTSRQDRDAWIEADPCRNGRGSRIATTRQAAMRDHAITNMQIAEWADDYADWSDESDKREIYAGMIPR